MTLPNLRVVHQNGSLIFLSFGPSSYMHDVHSAQYRCKASNAVGQIISGAVHVSAGKIMNIFIFNNQSFRDEKLKLFSVKNIL
jgi:hypothetical protein